MLKVMIRTVVVRRRSQTALQAMCRPVYILARYVSIELQCEPAALRRENSKQSSGSTRSQTTKEKEKHHKRKIVFD